MAEFQLLINKNYDECVSNFAGSQLQGMLHNVTKSFFFVFGSLFVPVFQISPLYTTSLLLYVSRTNEVRLYV